MAKPPRIGGEMRVFYPVFQVTELAAAYRYTTHGILAPERLARDVRVPVCLTGAEQCVQKEQTPWTRTRLPQPPGWSAPPRPSSTRPSGPAAWRRRRARNPLRR